MNKVTGEDGMLRNNQLISLMAHIDLWFDCILIKRRIMFLCNCFRKVAFREIQATPMNYFNRRNKYSIENKYSLNIYASKQEQKSKLLFSD